MILCHYAGVRLRPGGNLEADFGMETYDLGETVEAVALPDCVNTNYGRLPLESAPSQVLSM